MGSDHINKSAVRVCCVWEEVLKGTDVTLEGPNTYRLLSVLSRLIGSWNFVYCGQFTKFVNILYRMK